MDTIKEYVKISTWIAREIAGTIQQEEKEKLEQWLGAEEENLCIYENIRKRLSEEQEKRSYQKTENIWADWNKVQSRLKKENNNIQANFTMGSHYYHCVFHPIDLETTGRNYRYLKHDTPPFKDLCGESIGNLNFR